MNCKGRKMSQNTIIINFKKGELDDIPAFFTMDVDLTTMKTRQRERPPNRGNFQP